MSASVDLTPHVKVSQISFEYDFASTTAADISPEHCEITLYQQSQPEEEATDIVVKVKGAKIVVPPTLVNLDRNK